MKTLTRKSLVLFVACALSLPAWAQNVASEQALRRQIAEKEAEITSLRQQLKSVQTAGEHERPATAAGLSNPQSSHIGETEDITTALESALIRYGGAVLYPGTLEVEPELSYFYDEADPGLRRDALSTALSLRYGLPYGMQVEVYLPYIVRDRVSGDDTASGIGDIRLALTKELARDREGSPALLVFGRWKTKTGDFESNPPLGFGQHSLQAGVTMTKRMDPALLFGSLSYTSYLGSAPLLDGGRLDSGDVWGVRLGANLAATPSTSFYWGVAYDSSNADRLNDQRLELTDRTQGFLELGTTTTVGRGHFINIGVGIGITPAAPEFSITVSLPSRF